LSSERYNNQNLSGAMKIANIAGMNDNIIIGNAMNKIAWYLFQALKVGFTYAPTLENICLYGKKHIRSTFLPEIQQKRAWHNSCVDRQRSDIARSNIHLLENSF
jgi:hypothetical protein